MLLQFKFQNHKCFYDKTILDLTATLEKRHMEEIIDINGNKILPVIAIHGANASGKSSVLDALYFMCKTIKTSNYIDINNQLVTSPFAFSNKKFLENSEYEISFVLNNYEYRYGFSINKEEIEEEWLYKKKFTNNKRSIQKVIFERNHNQVNFSKSYNNYKRTWNLFKNDINFKKLLILSNLSIKEEHGILRSIYDFINKFNFRIESILDRNTSIDILTKNNTLFNKFQEIIKEFDPCLLGIQIDEISIDNEKSYKISGIHKSLDNNKTILLPLHKESDGTIKIFNIMPTILKNLELGGVLCIDELDVKLHPLLFKRIVNMYNDKTININNAQLIFTSHSTFMFNSKSLRRDEIYLVEKDKLGKSRLYSLSEFKNLRIDADYEKKYLTGQFGAIPYK